MTEKNSKTVQLTDKDFLRVEAGKLINRNSETVVLKGINFGGWLVQESWMCPVNGIDKKWANLDSLNELKNRGFSDNQIQELFDTYQDNWITKTDFDNLREMNISCVRVPFWYRNFMSDENGTWISGTDLNNNPGIKRLDYAIEECGKRGMYVILDMHGAPGGQMLDHCCGTLVKNELYDSPRYREIMEELWVKIADRYKESPVFAAYDIMNEPQNNNDYEGVNFWHTGTPEALKRTYSVYDQMYKAIRKVDPDHIITMEAIWDGDCLPPPNEFGWTNVMYQMHVYDRTKEGIDKRIGELKSFINEYGAAAYAGEFNCGILEDYVIEQFNKNGISWTSWAYKGAKQDNGNDWFLYTARKDIADTTTDSFEEIKAKWGVPLQTSTFTINSALRNSLRLKK